jgi:hypothetical protein
MNPSEKRCKLRDCVAQAYLPTPDPHILIPNWTLVPEGKGVTSREFRSAWCDVIGDGSTNLVKPVKGEVGAEGRKEKKKGG